MAQVSDPRNFDPVRVFGGGEGMLAGRPIVARVFPSDPAREPVGLVCLLSAPVVAVRETFPSVGLSHC